MIVSIDPQYPTSKDIVDILYKDESIDCSNIQMQIHSLDFPNGIKATIAYPVTLEWHSPKVNKIEGIVSHARFSVCFEISGAWKISFTDNDKIIYSGILELANVLNQ